MSGLLHVRCAACEGWSWLSSSAVSLFCACLRARSWFRSTRHRARRLRGVTHGLQPDGQARAALRRRTWRCLAGTAQGIVTITAWILWSRTPAANTPGPVTLAENMAIAVSTLVFGLSVYVFLASAGGLWRVIRMRRLLRLHAWEPFSGEVVLRSEVIPLSGCYLVDDQVEKVSVISAPVWRVAALRRLRQGKRAWRCGPADGPTVLMVESDGDLYLSRRPMRNERWAKRVRAVARASGGDTVTS